MYITQDMRANWEGGRQEAVPGAGRPLKEFVLSGRGVCVWEVMWLYLFSKLCRNLVILTGIASKVGWMGQVSSPGQEYTHLQSRSRGEILGAAVGESRHKQFAVEMCGNQKDEI